MPKMSDGLLAEFSLALGKTIAARQRLDNCRNAANDARMALLEAESDLPKAEESLRQMLARLNAAKP